MRHVGPRVTCMFERCLRCFSILFGWLRVTDMFVGDAYGVWIFWGVLGFDCGWRARSLPGVQEHLLSLAEKRTR